MEPARQPTLFAKLSIKMDYAPLVMSPLKFRMEIVSRVLKVFLTLTVPNFSERSALSVLKDSSFSIVENVDWSILTVGTTTK